MLKRLIEKTIGPKYLRQRSEPDYFVPADVILALDFGARLSDFPLPDDSLCESNRTMAELVCLFARLYPEARLIVQGEIGCGIITCHPAIDRARIKIISGCDIRLSGYLDTHEFFRQAVEHIKHLEGSLERRFNNVLLICHRAHLWRAKRTLEQLLFESRLRSIAVRIPLRDDLKTIPYDRQSSQWWTRGPVRWWLRELLATIPWYKFRRWI